MSKLIASTLQLTRSFDRRQFEPNQELSDLFNKLWDLDENRCESGKHYTLDEQGEVIFLPFLLELSNTAFH